MDKIRSKIISLGLGQRVDELINELGLNKNQITNRINEELTSRGQKEITYETVSRYLDWWAEKREEAVKEKLALIPQQTIDNKAGMAISLAIASRYDEQTQSALMTATAVETGLIKAITFYSAVMAAGLAKVLQDPDSVSVQDALRAADVLDRLQSGGKGFTKTILQNAIQINTGDARARMIKEADIIDAESFSN